MKTAAFLPSIRGGDGFVAALCRQLASHLRHAPALLAIFGLALCSVASAQTAHFSGYRAVLGSEVYENYSPVGIALDGNGNVYITDISVAPNRVLKFTPSGDGYTQSILVGGLHSVTGIAIDGKGNLYVGEGNDPEGDGCFLLKETPSAGDTYTQSAIASGCIYPSPSFDPVGVAVDVNGNVYWADNANSVVSGITLWEHVHPGAWSQTTHPTALLSLLASRWTAMATSTSPMQEISVF